FGLSHGWLLVMGWACDSMIHVSLFMCCNTSIQVRKRTNCLIVDFYYRGERCREQTALEDNAANRRKVGKLADRIEAEIAAGTFEYGRFFPGSKNVEKFAAPSAPHAAGGQEAVAEAAASRQAGVAGTPLLRDFAETWFAEKEVEWRRSHKKNVRADLDGRILPRWGDWEVGRITKTDVLAYRAELAKDRARSKETTLSNRRINIIVNLLRQVINEASDRYDFRTPFLNPGEHSCLPVSFLPLRKSHVSPAAAPYKQAAPARWARLAAGCRGNPCCSAGHGFRGGKVRSVQ
ncbi:MAG: integrase, partial [Gallionellaceae bacterium]